MRATPAKDGSESGGAGANAPCPERFTPSLVVPTLDNARTLARVLDALRPCGATIVVVDDGSTDDTPGVLDRWRRANADVDLHVERHARNRGKGRALRTGFEAAARLGATHAVSIDADGQHDAADVGPLLAVARAHPRALVLGVRPGRVSGCPRRCVVGRRVANLLVRAETLVRLEDTQCGLRVYPLGLVRTIGCRAERFGFETEIVVRAAWAGCEIVEARVSCVYEVPGGRVSHWRPVVDTVRDGFLHVRLVARSLVPIPHPRWPEEDDEVGAARRHARRTLAWLSPRSLWRAMRDASGRDSSMAASLALGAFVGCSPFYGLHAWLSLYLAWRLRLHPLPAVIGSLISTPPIGLAIVGASIQVGHLLLTGRPLGPSAFDAGAAPWWAISGRVLAAWLLGGVVVGCVVAACVYVIGRRAGRLLGGRVGGVEADQRAA